MEYKKLVSAPTVEPVSLQEAKRHLYLDAGSFEDNVISNQSIAPGSHGVVASYGLKGAGVDISEAGNVLAVLEAGTLGAGTTVDVKLQESDTDTDSAYLDADDGAFAQVTESTGNQSYSLQYLGYKKYVRAVATVASAASEFGLSIILEAPANTQDADIARLIKVGRRHCENFQNRAYVTQTWDLFLDHFPRAGEIRIPRPPLQSVTSLKYRDLSGKMQTIGFLDTSGTPLLETDDYIVDVVSEPGRLALKRGFRWPDTDNNIQAVQIRFVCGYGLAADVPEEIKQAILLKVGELYEHRGDELEDPKIERAIEGLLWRERIVPV